MPDDVSPTDQKTLAPAPIMTDARRDLAADLFDRLREMSFDGVGISRETYGAGETEAMEVIAVLGRDQGLGVEWDPARNLILTLPGVRPELPAVATGSHLDSVPQGGNYDGAAGVIAGLVALLAAKGRSQLRTMKLYVLRGEESAWYGGPCYFGSRALFGLLTDADFRTTHRETRETLATNMARCGVDLEAVAPGQPLLDAATLHSWVELHIEQGPVLVAQEKPAAVVTGIRGNVRHRRIVCRGQAAHSGAVPRWLRHDAVLAMAELLIRIDEHWRVLLEWGEDLVVTSGIVETNAAEHAVSRVPGEVSFSLEYRSQDVKTLRSFGDLLRSECATIEAKRGVSFDLGQTVFNEPARMSQPLVDIVQASAADAGVDLEVLPSGAGHDSAVFANAGVPSTMVFVRNQNGSHNPDEAMELQDFLDAAEVLGQALLRAADMKEEVRP